MSTYKGYEIAIETHRDDDMGPPWKEHDGHGIVSDWEHRDKEPGELLLHEDHGSKRYYDFKGTLEIAKRDGWGLGEKAMAKLTAKCGRKPTRKQVIATAVMADFEYLRGWCNDEWQWLGYTTTITTPDGEVLRGDSCWGFDGGDYMADEAQSQAEAFIDRHILTVEQTELAEVFP